MPIPSEAFGVRLISARMLSESVRELIFERTDGRAMDFLPGQWVNLLLPLPSGEIKRAYSIASAPRPHGPHQGRFELAVTWVKGGAGSAYLHSIPAGTELRAVGPQGFFYRPAHTQEPALMVATGTGVTPLRSMIQAALASGQKAPICLLFGARNEAERLYLDEFESYSKQYDHFQYLITLSRPGELWTGRKGYVQAHLPGLWESLQARSENAPLHLYVCGLDRMVSAVREIAKSGLGLDRKRIHHERYD